jgi:hypothetical protein
LTALIVYTALLVSQTGRGEASVADLYIRNFPKELRQLAKAEAALQDVTLREIMVEALTAYLKAQDKKRAKKKGG